MTTLQTIARHIRKNRPLLSGLSVFVLLYSFFFQFDIGTSKLEAMLLPKQAIAKVLVACFGLPEYERVSCLYEKLPALFEKYHKNQVVEITEQFLVELGHQSACHEEAHVLGETLYSAASSIERTMSACTPACHNGCQHGALGAFARSGQSLERIVELDVGHLCTIANDDWARQALCFHGLGHLFMVAREGEILESLQDCDRSKIKGGQLLQCWSGVFMENAVNTMEAGGKYLRADEPLFPCTWSALPEQYRESCYRQPPVPTFDTKESFEICRSAPARWQRSCAFGLGIKSADLWSADPQIVVERCRTGAPDLHIPCLQGASVFFQYGTFTAEERSHLTHFCLNLGKGESFICGSGSSL